MGSHVELEHNPFIKWVSYVDPNMTWTHLGSTHDLFINGLVISGLWVTLDFATRDFLCEIFTRYRGVWDFFSMNFLIFK